MNNKNSLFFIFILLILSLLSGCTLSVLDTGETLPPHKMEVGVSVPIVYPCTTLYVFSPTLSLRYGIGDNLDGEVHTFLGGMAGGYKYRFIKTPFTFSVGAGGGAILTPGLLPYLVFWNITGYISKKFYFGTPYTAYRYNRVLSTLSDFKDIYYYPIYPLIASGNYPIITCGISFPLFYWLDILGEADAIALQGRETSYYGNVRLNFHDIKFSPKLKAILNPRF